MSEFVLSGSDVFGKYCLIETGRNREKHIYKVIQSLKSNYYRDAPLYCGMDKETNHNSLDDVLLVIHCGIDETEVIKVAAKDAEFILNETEKQNAELKRLLRLAMKDMPEMAFCCFGFCCNKCVRRHIGYGKCVEDSCFEWKHADEAMRLLEN